MQETDEQLTVDLVSETDEVSVTKRYRFTRGSYLIEVSFLISNQSTDRLQANAFGQIKRDVFDDPSAVGGLVALISALSPPPRMTPTSESILMSG